MHTKTTDNLEISVRSGAPETAVILLHGFGANMHDLAPLADVLDPMQQKTWYFPNGILQIPLSPMYDARAWAMLNLQAFDQAIKQKRFRDYLSEQSEQLLKPCQMVSDFVESIAPKHQRIYIGGFSQGAILALDVALSMQREWAGLILLSTTFAAEKRWQEFLQNEKRVLRIFQSHGLSDTVLPFGEAKALYENLQSHGHNIAFHEFAGGHEIPPATLKELNLFLR